MKLVCRNLFLRGPLAKQSRCRRAQPAATDFTGVHLAAGTSRLRNAVFIWPMVS
jgi:hypothetical protein